jgi:hypothetical protein
LTYKKISYGNIQQEAFSSAAEALTDYPNLRSKDNLEKLLAIAEDDKLAEGPRVRALDVAWIILGNDFILLKDALQRMDAISKENEGTELGRYAAFLVAAIRLAHEPGADLNALPIQKYVPGRAAFEWGGAKKDRCPLHV